MDMAINCGFTEMQFTGFKSQLTAWLTNVKMVHQNVHYFCTLYNNNDDDDDDNNNNNSSNNNNNNK